ncbi:hypothetical protein AB1Y20_017356 [Prymnesium parvum]|uniref:Uncharacterized protein n=1 Tax=Prymnesium parvum TaxID=97485 RepID=A0AB34JLD3_PRYPA
MRRRRAQRCLRHFSTAGRWTDGGETWTSPSTAECRWRAILPAAARRLLAAQHLVIIGDLHARLLFSSLVYLLNGTAAPEEVGLGFMPHRWREGSECAWHPTRQAAAWYDWAGWGEFPKTHRCHVRAYGWPNLHNVTLPRATSWWGVGDARDVMTMLQKESPHHQVFAVGTTTVTYVWRSVIRTIGSSVDGPYKRQHARVVDKVCSLVGRGPPTLIIPVMYAFDAQWQEAKEVATRMRGLFQGLRERFSSAQLLTLGPSSCQPRRPFSVYMGRTTRHNTFHNVENASALAPYALEAAQNQSVLFVDTLPSKIAFVPTSTTPCKYDLPLGPMSEALVQIVLNGLASVLERPST